jgi:hypothetical protein
MKQFLVILSGGDTSFQAQREREKEQRTKNTWVVTSVCKLEQVLEVLSFQENLRFQFFKKIPHFLWLETFKITFILNLNFVILKRNFGSKKIKNCA